MANSNVRERSTEVTVAPVERYRERTPTSADRFANATNVMPGGNTRIAVYHEPYPTYLTTGHECYVRDIDDNEYLDFVNNMTSLIHGHAHDAVVQAATDSVARGSAPGGPTEAEINWATHLCDRIPGLDLIRFTNSGTEATANAIRAARAFTGKDVIAKFEGVYHGTHDDSQISVAPPLHLAGPASKPRSVPDTAGIPASKLTDVLVMPFNDVENSLAELTRRQDDLAGILLAPVFGSSIIPAEQEFVSALDEFSTETGIPIIFDEIISFRLNYGGAHECFDITPDLMAFGKVIGGGFPVGAFGGRAEIMSAFDPQHEAQIVHSGTFNANPVTATAGLTALEGFDPSAVNRLNSLCDELVPNIRAIFDDHGITCVVNRAGSLFNIYLTPKSVQNYRDKRQSATGLEHELFIRLANEGIRLAPNLMGSLSTPMDREELDVFISSLNVAVEGLKKSVEREAPDLIQ